MQTKCYFSLGGLLLVIAGCPPRTLHQVDDYVVVDTAAREGEYRVRVDGERVGAVPLGIVHPTTCLALPIPEKVTRERVITLNKVGPNGHERTVHSLRVPALDYIPQGTYSLKIIYLEKEASMWEDDYTVIVGAAGLFPGAREGMTTERDGPENVYANGPTGVKARVSEMYAPMWNGIVFMKVKFRKSDLVPGKDYSLYVRNDAKFGGAGDQTSDTFVVPMTAQERKPPEAREPFRPDLGLLQQTGH